MDGKKKSLHPTEIPRRVGRLVEEKTSRISPTDTLKCLSAALIAFYWAPARSRSPLTPWDLLFSAPHRSEPSTLPWGF